MSALDRMSLALATGSAKCFLEHLDAISPRVLPYFRKERKNDKLLGFEPLSSVPKWRNRCDYQALGIPPLIGQWTRNFFSGS